MNAQLGSDFIIDKIKIEYQKMLLDYLYKDGNSGVQSNMEHLLQMFAIDIKNIAEQINRNFNSVFDKYIHK